MNTTESIEFRIYGASDDLVEVEGAVSDEFSASSGEWVGQLTAPTGEALNIVAQFGYRTQGWTIGVQQIDADTDAEVAPVPDWGIAIRNSGYGLGECDYSPTLVVTAPAGTTLAEVSS